MKPRLWWGNFLDEILEGADERILLQDGVMKSMIGTSNRLEFCNHYFSENNTCTGALSTRVSLHCLHN